MKSLYKLQAKGWFSNIMNKMDFVMTFMFLVVLGSFISFGFDYSNANEKAQLSSLNITMISSIVLLMVASSSINTFGISFYEMKESVLLKRIGATEITKIQAVGAFVLWGMTSMLMIIGWMAVIVGVCQIPAVAKLTGGALYVLPDAWQNVNWVGVVLAIVITMVSFYAIAFLLVSVSKNSNSYQILSTFYFFLISFLGGAYTPNADILWMDVIGFLSPLGWGRDLMSASMQGVGVGQIFDFVHGYDVLFNGIDKGTYDSIHSSIEGQTFGQLKLLAIGSGLNFPDISNWDEIKDLTITADQTNELIGFMAPKEFTGLKALGNILMPIIYGGLAMFGSAKLFKWD